MTCKDCVHFDICYARQLGGEITENAEDCKKFKDKSRFSEIVRCKNCRNWDYGDCYRIELTRPNDFCSYGERMKTDGS